MHLCNIHVHMETCSCTLHTGRECNKLRNYRLTTNWLMSCLSCWYGKKNYSGCFTFHQTTFTPSPPSPSPSPKSHLILLPTPVLQLAGPYTHASPVTPTHVHTHTCTQTCTYTYTHMYTHTHTQHTHTHTHTHMHTSTYLGVRCLCHNASHRVCVSSQCVHACFGAHVPHLQKQDNKGEPLAPDEGVPRGGPYIPEQLHLCFHWQAHQW